MVHLGNFFCKHFISSFLFPNTLTKISLRKSGIKSPQSDLIIHLIQVLPKLRELDVSENDLSLCADGIFLSAMVHPRLRSIIMEKSKISKSSAEYLIYLLNNNRKIQIIRVSPMKVSSSLSEDLEQALQSNRTISEVSVNPKFDSISKLIYQRNSLIQNYISKFEKAPFDSQRKKRNLPSYKSVKGNQMITNRAAQAQELKKTDPSRFEMIEKADRRAKQNQTNISFVDFENRFRSGLAETIGRRPSMEDIMRIIEHFPNEGSITFCLFDGHGGREAAEYASQHLPQHIQEFLENSPNMKKIFEASFLETQKYMTGQFYYVGTTAVVAIIHENFLYVGSVGDSRCILCHDGSAIRMTIDHKPNLPEEEAFIKKKGGYVYDNRVGGQLAVSRALGDGFLGEILNSNPTFKQVELTPLDTFMILACDGVWDVISDQEACDLVSTDIDPLSAAIKLRDAAYNAGSTDNISVMIVFLQ